MYTNEDRAGGHHFGTRGRGSRDDLNPRDLLASLRHSFAEHGQRRTGRGDVRSAILVLLAEQPMHGYQLMHEIEERSDGAWRPSPGSVYPTLQMLDDENLVNVEQSDGRKVYALTEEGKAAAEPYGDGSELWGKQDGSDSNRRELSRSGAKLGQAVFQVLKTGTAEEQESAAQALDTARRAIYSMLADQH